MTAATDAPQPAVRLAIFHPADPDDLRIGGINTFVRGLVKFAPQDWDIALVGMSSDRQLRRWHEVEFEGRLIRFFPVLRSTRHVRTAVPIVFRFTVALRLASPRLELAGWIGSVHRPGVDLALPLNVPAWRVVHLSGADLSGPGSESRWRLLRGTLHRMEHRTFRRMDRVYVVNSAVTVAYRRRYAELADRFRFLPNWVDTTIFAPLPAGDRRALRARLRGELGLKDGPIVLFAGRLEAQKDPVLAARAFAKFAMQRPDAALLVAGDGGLFAELQGALAEEGATAGARLIGTVTRERLASLMNASDAFLLTSRFETGPTVGLEALACGLPIVTTRVGEVAAAVQAHGAGVVVDEPSVEQLADALWAVAVPRGAASPEAVAAAAPHRSERVLGELYAYNREFAARLSRPGRP